MDRRLVSLAVLIMSVAATGAGAAGFTGSLTSANGGIVATPYWQTVTLQWTVTQLVDMSWKYNYDLLVSQNASQAKNISHMLIETSPLFSEFDDILSTNWASRMPDEDDIEVQQWTSQQGNPGIPGTLYGIKFNTVSPLPAGSSGTHWLVEIVSNRVPVWGDFYAKDGKIPGTGTDITAWNAGFLLPDPTDDAANGSINNKILRPDTKDTMIPEMSAPVLASLAGLFPLVAAVLRRRQ